MKLFRDQKGMTVAEILVASAFGLFLTAGVVAFASFFERSQHEYRTTVELTNDARLVMERMVWGAKLAGQTNRRGIAEAVSGSIVSPTQFQYTDVDGAVHSLRVNSGTVEYQYGSAGAWNTLLDPNGASRSYDANMYTTSLSFTQPANNNSVVVRVVIGRKILDRWHYGSSSTQVFYRNA